MRPFSYTLALVLLLLLPSCATLLGDRNDLVRLDSNPSGANVTVNGAESHVTPVSLIVLGDTPLHLHFTKEGYLDAQQLLDVKFSSLVLFDLAFLYLAPIPLGIDMVTGYAYEHVEDSVYVTLVPVGSETPRPAPQPSWPAVSVLLPPPPPRVDDIPGEPLHFGIRYGFLGGSELNLHNHEFQQFRDGDSLSLRLWRCFRNSGMFWLVEGRYSSRTEVWHGDGITEWGRADLRQLAAGLGYRWTAGDVFQPRLIGTVHADYLDYVGQYEVCDGDCRSGETDWQRNFFGFDVSLETAIKVHDRLSLVPGFRAGYAGDADVSMEIRELGLGVEVEF